MKKNLMLVAALALLGLVASIDAREIVVRSGDVLRVVGQKSTAVVAPCSRISGAFKSCTRNSQCPTGYACINGTCQCSNSDSSGCGGTGG